jgi:hypothetical protein
MAADKNAPKGQVELFDISKYLEGTDLGGKDDFREVLGLVPAYVPEVAFNSSPKWEPIVGRLLRVNKLPEQNPGTKNAHIPLAYEILLSKPNQGVIGGKDKGRKIVQVNKGETIQVFISGNLRTKRDILTAALDEESLWPIVMFVEGQQSVNNLTPMWVWKTMLGGKSIPRPAQFKILGQGITQKDVATIVEGDLEELRLLGEGMPNSAPGQQTAPQATA